jgi:hypothetical protein
MRSIKNEENGYGHDLGEITSSYIYAYTCVRDLFIGGVVYLAENIIR